MCIRDSIIEPSGVGKLSDVAKAVIDMQDEAGVEIESLITVADGKKAKMYMKNFGEFYNDQLEHAGVIVISRTPVSYTHLDVYKRQAETYSR